MILNRTVTRSSEAYSVLDLRIDVTSPSSSRPPNITTVTF